MCSPTTTTTVSTCHYFSCPLLSGDIGRNYTPSKRLQGWRLLWSCFILSGHMVAFLAAELVTDVLATVLNGTEVIQEIEEPGFPTERPAPSTPPEAAGAGAWTDYDFDEHDPTMLSDDGEDYLETLERSTEAPAPPLRSVEAPAPPLRSTEAPAPPLPLANLVSPPHRSSPASAVPAPPTPVPSPRAPTVTQEARPRHTRPPRPARPPARPAARPAARPPVPTPTAPAPAARRSAARVPAPALSAAAPSPCPPPLPARIELRVSVAAEGACIECVLQDDHPSPRPERVSLVELLRGRPQSRQPLAPAAHAPTRPG